MEEERRRGGEKERTGEKDAHCDVERVAVWDLVVYYGLDVDGLQLEVYGDVDQPEDQSEQRRVIGYVRSVLMKAILCVQVCYECCSVLCEQVFGLY